MVGFWWACGGVLVVFGWGSVPRQHTGQARMHIPMPSSRLALSHTADALPQRSARPPLSDPLAGERPPPRHRKLGDLRYVGFVGARREDLLRLATVAEYGDGFTMGSISRP